MPAQTFTALHAFPPYGGANSTNSDGTSPEAGLVASDDNLTLYGTTSFSGGFGNGTVFGISADGQVFTNLHNFSAVAGSAQINADGALPYGGLILSSNVLYGTAYIGGSAGKGAIFSVRTDGTAFTNLHSFSATSGANATNGDGVNSRARLLLSGNVLYGTATGGGTFGSGTVFALNTDGTGFTNLHNFSLVAGSAPSSNSDGAFPRCQLALSGNVLFGSANGGGQAGLGALFALNTDGTGFTNLHNFSAYSGASTNNDGSYPVAGLIVAGNVCYGTAEYGAAFARGNVFALHTDGTGFTNLHTFASSTNGQTSNFDGGYPYAKLALLGRSLYGTTTSGGNASYGIVFKVNIDGTGYGILHSFTALGGFRSTNTDGIEPFGGVISAGNNLFGTTLYGGSGGYGTVYEFSLPAPPQLNITQVNTNVVLTWLTNATGFTLQSATNLAAPAIWTTVSPLPTVVNGFFTVTNTISGTEQFYRLIQ